MKKKMAVAFIAAMTVAAGAGSVVVQAAPQETKAEETKTAGTNANADVISLDLLDKDIYYIGVGENEETVILGAAEDWSDYEALVTVAGRMTIISSEDVDEQEGKEIVDDMSGASMKVSEDKESITITLIDGRTLKAERSELAKSVVELIGVINTFDSAVERGELEVE